jgi:uncharacterized protein (TIGR01244 family)
MASDTQETEGTKGTRDTRGIRRLCDTIGVAGALTEGDLEGARRAGYRTVIDLRGDGEPTPRGLCPSDERLAAGRLGLGYLQVPIEPETFDHVRVEIVRRKLDSACGPVLLHCATGRRAAALALLHECFGGRALGDCFALGPALGLRWDDAPALRDRWMRYVLDHRDRTTRDATVPPEATWRV